jgi:uncharacterized repeat protein (TIGR03943 family)
MVFFGGAILRATMSDVYLRYVKEGLRPFLIAAGILLVVAAVVALVHEFRDHRRTSTEHDDDGHGHHHSGAAAGWLLLLPTLALLFVTPPALGADTAVRAGSALSNSPKGADGSWGDYSPFPPLPSGDPVKLTLFDYGSRALYGDGKTLRDRQVQLTGFIAPGADGQPMLARIILSCCAADGIPVKIGLSGDVPRLPSDSWVQATGRWVPQTAKDPVNGSDIPYLEVDTWQQVAPPKNPYE